MDPQRNLRLIFQRRLKQAREVQKLSQKELGIQAGLDPFVASTRINRYELGVHQPDLTTVQRLADQLGVPAAFLFADDDRLARLIVAFDRLPARDKDRLVKALENGEGVAGR